MKKSLLALALSLAIPTSVLAETIDTVEFSNAAGGFTVRGKSSAGAVSVQLLERTLDGNELDRLQYATIENVFNTQFFHTVKVKNPNGLYVLKTNDGTKDEPLEQVIYMSDKLSADGVNTDMPEEVSIGDTINVSTRLRNYTSGDILLYYTAAYYDADNRLISCDLKKIISNASQEEKISFEVPALDGLAKVRIMAMDEEMHPLGMSKSAAVRPRLSYYVENGGNGDGTLENPFGSIAAALSAAGGNECNIFLREGVYTEKVNLNNLTNVTIAGYPGEDAVLTNSVSLADSGFKSVSDQTMKNRFKSSVRNNIKEFDLTAAGISGAGVIPKISFGGTQTPYDVLTINGERGTIARFPNEGYTQIYTSNSCGAESMSFKYIYTPADNWQTADKFWVCGYWGNGWSQYSMPATMQRVNQPVKTKDHYYDITTEGSAGSLLGGLPAGRFYVFNIPEELDVPGEWFIDQAANKLYVYPTSDFGNVRLSYNAQTAVSLTSCNNVTIQNIKFDNIKGTAIEAGTSNSAIKVVGCKFTNIAKDCISIDSTDSVVANCVIKNVGAAGIRMQGGNRNQLIDAENLVYNNDISNYALDYRVYCPAVGVAGCGSRVAHNKISNGPHVAIQFAGNDHVMEYNEITNVCTETGDAGAIYAGRNLIGNGNIIRYNYIDGLNRVKYVDEDGSTIKYSAPAEVVAVYLDDLFSGAEVYGNILNNVDIGVLMGGGSNNVIENNIIMNKTNSESVAISCDARGTDGRDISGIIDTSLGIYNSGKSAWNKKFPGVEAVFAAGNQGKPINNVIRNNAMYKHTMYDKDSNYSINTQVSELGTVESNVVLSQAPGFVDPANGNYTLQAGAQIFTALPQFKSIPFARIGLE